MEEIKEKSIVGKALDVYFSDTPKWAKIVRFIGIGLAAIGGTLSMTNPITAPIGIAFLVPYAGYFTMTGTFTALFVQGFSKK